MRIVASHSFADGLAAALGERPRAPVAPLAVWVEWDATERTSEPFTLTARSGGAELARASAAASHAPLALELDEARLGKMVMTFPSLLGLRVERTDHVDSSADAASPARDGPEDRGVLAPCGLLLSNVDHMSLSHIPRIDGKINIDT